MASLVAPINPPIDPPLVLIAGPTASGKSTLALHLAQHFNGEIVSCDSVAVYRGMEIGTAKPTPAERALIPHHLLDVVDPNQPFTAGDFSRLARIAIAGITARGKLPIVAGGTGLYLRALTDGLFPAPPTVPALREKLRTRPPARLHPILRRLDPIAAARIHPNDSPKLIRAIEVSLTARQSITSQWQARPRDLLTGFRILRLALNPPRPALYARIDQRAATMFRPATAQPGTGLLEETEGLLARFGPQRPFASLGYAQAAAVLRHEITLPDAIAGAQQGHRNYAKRQLTWFRRDPGTLFLPNFGSHPAAQITANQHLENHLKADRTNTCPNQSD